MTDQSIDKLVADIAAHHSSLTGKPFGPLPEIVTDRKRKVELFEEGLRIKAEEEGTKFSPSPGWGKLLIAALAYSLPENFHAHANAISIKGNVYGRIKDYDPYAESVLSHEMGHAHHLNILQNKNHTEAKKSFRNRHLYEQVFLEGVALRFQTEYLRNKYAIPEESIHKRLAGFFDIDEKKMDLLKKIAHASQKESFDSITTPKLGLMIGIKFSGITYQLGNLYVQHELKEGHTIYEIMTNPPHSTGELTRKAGLLEGTP